ncbi:hypothetical protein D6D27_04596 [Aureobasidium pullulans]|nr:hypothetical protein D6D27_04596 [Aureobasidium pullulans]
MMDVKVDTTQNVWDDYYDYLNDTNLNLQTIDLDIIDAEGISEILLISVFRVRRLMMQANRHMDGLRTLAKRIDVEHGLELEKKAHVVNVELFRQYTNNVQKHFVVLLEPWRAVVYGRAAKVFDKEEGVIQTTDKERTTELAATRNDQERSKAFTDASELRVRAG